MVSKQRHYISPCINKDTRNKVGGGSCDETSRQGNMSKRKPLKGGANFQVDSYAQSGLEHFLKLCQRYLRKPPPCRI